MTKKQERNGMLAVEVALILRRKKPETVAVRIGKVLERVTRNRIRPCGRENDSEMKENG